MFIGEPSRACFKCSALQMYVFVSKWQKKKRKLFSVSAFYRASGLCSQYFIGSTPVLLRKYYSTFREVLRYWLRSTGEVDYYSPFRDFNNSSFASLCISAFNTS